MENTLKFFWNGIKANGGKLQKCWYSDGELINHPNGTITIYAREYSRFSVEIAEAFTVANDSDIMTDYFEKDRIRVDLTHPLYGQVKEALAKHTAHFDKRFGKEVAA